MNLNAPNATLACMGIVCALAVGLYACDSCGCTLDTRPVVSPHVPPPAPPVAQDDAGAEEDAGKLEREWRELITPQPAPRTSPRDHCERPAYRNKRECRAGQTRLQRRHANHGVGC